MARWRSGDAADCKSVYAGSIPARASKMPCWVVLILQETSDFRHFPVIVATQVWSDPPLFATFDGSVYGMIAIAAWICHHDRRKFAEIRSYSGNFEARSAQKRPYKLANRDGLSLCGAKRKPRLANELPYPRKTEDDHLRKVAGTAAREGSCRLAVTIPRRADAIRILGCRQ